MASISLLAGDMGGTKTLLGLFSWDGLQLRKLHQHRYSSAQWAEMEPMLEHFLDNRPANVAPPSHSCIAVAGPVHGETAQITNLCLSLNQKQLLEACGGEQLELVNDFAVLIYGLQHLSNDQQVVLQQGGSSIPADGPLAILGAGTGLGIARGVPTPGGLMAMPSEGGHQEFSPRTAAEWELALWLKADLQIDRLSVERIVSGTGLGHVADWRLQLDDARDHPLRAQAHAWRHQSADAADRPDLPALASQAAADGDPLMQEALQLWLSAYGSIAGDLAIQELCTGGLWIGGGTAAKQLAGLRSWTFLEALLNKGRFRPLLEQLPVRAVIDPGVGLFSAACRARMLAESGGTLA